MRKKIAVYIGEIAGAYQQTIMKVITAKANALGYDVMAICSYGSYNDDILYAEGEKASIYLADPSTFDGIIVTEDLFDNPGMGDELYEILKRDATCPVVYLRTVREEFYSILLENTVSIENMVRHFTDDHGFTEICYMSGKEGTLDSEERLQGFLNAMQAKNLPVTEHSIFHGDFWRDKGQAAMDWFMEGRTTYPQAIVCANDYMALSICDELRKRGVRVPEDVCVSGFDFVQEARTYKPTLTSLEVDFESMSARAVDIIENVNNGIKQELIQRIPAKLILNKSCGCGEQYKLEDLALFIEDNYKQTSNMKNIMLLSMEYQDCFEMDEFMAIADKYRYCIKAGKEFFCFSDIREKNFEKVENDSRFSENMILIRVLEDPSERTICNISFPRRELLPKAYWKEEEPNNFFFFPIHFKNIVYGYMVAENPYEEWFDIYTQSYLLNLANAIENGNVHSRMARLEEIRALYQKDALTGIYNRRGFDKLLRDRFAKAKASGEDFAVASIDMDNLKVVNDSFGHSAGDEALIIVAKALEEVMEENEFCARVGGDEFAAGLNCQIPNRVEIFKQRFAASVKKYGDEYPEYNVGASIGICALSEDPGMALINLLQTADMRMYADKKSRKVPR